MQKNNSAINLVLIAVYLYSLLTKIRYFKFIPKSKTLPLCIIIDKWI